MQSVVEIGNALGAVPLPENQSVTPQLVLDIHRTHSKDQVREFED